MVLLNAPILADSNMENDDDISLNEINNSAKNAVTKETTVWFRYKDEPLINIINDLGKKRGINIMLPQGPNALSAKVNFSLPKRISLDDAWQYLLTILKISGFTITPGKESSSVIKIDQNTIRENLPLYINTSAEDIPSTDLTICYLRYLVHLQVPGAGANSGVSLQTLLTDLLPSGNPIIFEPLLNAFIITDTARSIKSVMEIIEDFDNTTETLDPTFIKLEYTTASDIKALLDQLIPGSTDAQASGGAAPAAGSILKNSGYFSKGTRTFVEPRNNRLILLGKKDATERIKEFIKKNIDVPLEKGNSILHYYNLQWKDPATFVDVLTQILNNQSTSSSGQSTSSSTSHMEQSFDGVIIVADNLGATSGADSSGGGTQKGSRLIVAARNKDWVRIEALIKQLDVPQKQVLVTGIIADMSTTAIKDLGSQVRNPKNLFLKNVNWQAGNLGGLEVGVSPTTTPPNPPGLSSNLLPVASSTGGAGNIAYSSSAGSFMLSAKDPNDGNNIWWIARLINTHSDSKILSQPFLMAINNQSVTFTNTITRRLAGSATQEFGTVVQNKEDKDATISLTILPRISEDGTTNLTITITISEFIDTTGATNNRNLVTNVNIKNGEILVLGGLTKKKLTNSVNETPGFSKIPIIGPLFFKDQSKTLTETELMFFVRIEEVPLLRKGRMNSTTNKALHKGNALLKSDENFSQLKDPITRWFFGTKKEDQIYMLEGFLDAENVHINNLEEQKNKGQFVAHAVPMPTSSPARASSTPENKIAKAKEEPQKTVVVAQNTQKPKTVKTNKNEQKEAAEELKRLFAFEDVKPKNSFIKKQTSTPAPKKAPQQRRVAAAPRNKAGEMSRLLDENPEVEQIFRMNRG